MYINSTGFYIPSGRISNDYFKEVNGLTSDWIEQRTGIITRSKAEDDNVDSMAQKAVDNALEHLAYDIKDVDLIVAAHYCACDLVATVAHKIQRHYGISHAKALYLSSACSSFINGLEVIEGYFASGKAKKALLVCSEHNTYYSNESDPKTGHLWGDAAVAFFISNDKTGDDDVRIIDVFTEGLGDKGKGASGVSLRPKEDGITMNDGRDVFIHACRYMIYALDKSLTNSNMERTDISRFITHQANKRIVAQVAHQLEIPMDRFENNIEEYGNTGSASAALVFAERKKEFKKGEKVALMVFGGGYSCGAFIVEI